METEEEEETQNEEELNIKKTAKKKKIPRPMYIALTLVRANWNLPQLKLKKCIANKKRVK